ncbi:MAG: hypothetical protein HY774_28705 [Acidobacteria bacterium]|nr:hypothetical protein [Acidobacteriota bacterium]
MAYFQFQSHCFVKAIFSFLFFMGLAAPNSLPVKAQQTGAMPPSKLAVAVEQDFRAGMGGNQEAFDRAMKSTEELLVGNPAHAEALVWHGSGLVSKSGKAFMAGDFQQGSYFMEKGLGEMAKAVELEPDNVHVRFTRGSTLLILSKVFPIPDTAQECLAKGLVDFEMIVNKLGSSINAAPIEWRGHVLVGLASGWKRSGNEAKAKTYAQQAVALCPGTKYETQARELLATIKN